MTVLGISFNYSSATLLPSPTASTQLLRAKPFQQFRLNPGHFPMAHKLKALLDDSCSSSCKCCYIKKEEVCQRLDGISSATGGDQPLGFWDGEIFFPQFQQFLKTLSFKHALNRFVMWKAPMRFYVACSSPQSFGGSP